MTLVALANRLFTEARLRGALFVLNKIADKETERFLRRELAALGVKPVGVIREDPDIRKAWLTGSVVNGANACLEVETIVQELEKAVAESTEPV
jgi:CO dehydrogenase nickel-insertion accessory protein CooC1